MSDYVSCTEKQEKILLKIKEISKSPISNDRLTKFIKVFNENKTIDQVCEVYMFKKFLKRKELYIYDTDGELYDFNILDEYYKQKNDTEKNHRWIEYTSLYKKSLAINVKYSHECIQDVIKAIYDPQINYSINTKKV